MTWPNKLSYENNRHRYSEGQNHWQFRIPRLFLSKLSSFLFWSIENKNIPDDLVVSHPTNFRLVPQSPGASGHAREDIRIFSFHPSLSSTPIERLEEDRIHGQLLERKLYLLSHGKLYFIIRHLGLRIRCWIQKQMTNRTSDRYCLLRSVLILDLFVRRLFLFVDGLDCRGVCAFLLLFVFYKILENMLIDLCTMDIMIARLCNIVRILDITTGQDSCIICLKS